MHLCKILQSSYCNPELSQYLTHVKVPQICVFQMVTNISFWDSRSDFILVDTGVNKE